MSTDESTPGPSEIREPKAEEPALPAAWQPLTPRGVAAFSRATLGRVLLLQFIVALLVTASVIWFLATTWFPSIRDAIRQLPETGQVQNQELDSPRTSNAPLVETRLLGIVMDLEGVGTPALSSDLRAVFHRRSFALCGVLGCLVFDYPRDRTVPFNRLELESWRVAWAPVLYTAIALAVIGWLFLNWVLLATIYCPLVRIYSFFKDRQITLAGSWKLCAAALLPGALMTAIGVVLYGTGMIDLVSLLVLFVLHVTVGWAYLLASPLRLPGASDALSVPKQNPFTPPGEAPTNPFTDPSGTPADDGHQ
jgi:hypothetical protein